MVGPLEALLGSTWNHPPPQVSDAGPPRGSLLESDFHAFHNLLGRQIGMREPPPHLLQDTEHQSVWCFKKYWQMVGGCSEGSSTNISR